MVKKKVIIDKKGSPVYEGLDFPRPDKNATSADCTEASLDDLIEKLKKQIKE